MSFTVTMVLTAPTRKAFDGLTLGKTLDGGATIQAFGIGDYIALADKVREDIDENDRDDDTIACAARVAFSAHDANVTEQLKIKEAAK